LLPGGGGGGRYDKGIFNLFVALATGKEGGRGGSHFPGSKRKTLPSTQPRWGEGRKTVDEPLACGSKKKKEGGGETPGSFRFITEGKGEKKKERDQWFFTDSFGKKARYRGNGGKKGKKGRGEGFPGRKRFPMERLKPVRESILTGGGGGKKKGEEKRERVGQLAKIFPMGLYTCRPFDTVSGHRERKKGKRERTPHKT